MHSKAFGTRIIKQFRKAFPKLVFSKVVLTNGYSTIVQYNIHYNKDYLGYLLIFENYNVSLFLYSVNKHCYTTSYKDRLKIFQILHEECIDLGLYK